MQAELLPLYLESQNIVKWHKKCLLAIQEERLEIPDQLIKLIDQGLMGIE